MELPNGREVSVSAVLIVALISAAVLVVFIVSTRRPATKDNSSLASKGGAERSTVDREDCKAFSFAVFALSHIGKKRKNNEDDFFIDAARRVYAAFDGMGGKAAGEVASLTAKESFAASGATRDSLPAREWMKTAVESANQAVFRRSLEDPAFRGMGTTLVAAAIEVDGLAVMASSGDSRAYLFRDGKLSRLTQDDDLASVLLRAGLIKESEHEKHPYRHVLARYLGQEENAQASFLSLQLRRGDLLLLCTDGLNRVLPDIEIESLLNSERNPETACRTLVERTLAGGAPDNIAVVLVSVL